MFLPDSPLLFKTRQLANAVRPLGGRALLVGGFVRDALLGQNPKDADVEVYGLPADQLKTVLETLGRVDAVGESFRVLKLVWHAKNAQGIRERLELDVSLPRRDRKTGTGHKGFEVEGDPFATVEDAARRRDFTLNAILCDPLTEEILDPFGGQTDLRAGLLRAVDARHFGEDSLRVLRAMQFAARFNLTIEPETIALCRQTPLDDLPRERVWGEWEKWLLKSTRPSVGLIAGRETGVFARLFPYIETALARNGDEMGAALDGAAREIRGLELPEAVALMLATISSYLDADSPADEPENAALELPEAAALMLATIGSFLGFRDTRRLLEDLGIFRLKGSKESVDVQNLTLKLVSARKTPSDWFRKRDQILPRDFRYFAARIPPQLALKLARARGHYEAATWFEAGLRAADVEFGPPAPLLQGRHLIEMGWKSGPLFGKVCARVYLMQLAGDVTTLDQAKAAAQTLMP
ncbi:multifunctional CCA protein [Abditibacteriota bacterium]|nr:multifunctional CCA protein [Abditibacteriota bacterium]